MSLIISSTFAYALILTMSFWSKNNRLLKITLKADEYLSA
jgi:hypothetical protein